MNCKLERLVRFLSDWRVMAWMPEKQYRRWEPWPRFRVTFGKTWGIRLWFVNIAITKAKLYKPKRAKQ